MIVLQKIVRKDLPKYIPFIRQDFSEHWKTFGFNDTLNRVNAKKQGDLIYANPILMADIVSAVDTKLFSSENLRRQEFVPKALKFCRDICVDMGYFEADLNEIIDGCPKEAGNIIFVAGCQDDDLLFSRVRTAKSICLEFMQSRCKVNLIFSGKNPGTDPVKIHDESLRMESYFWTLFREEKIDIKKFVNITPINERMSTNSKTNIKEMLNIFNNILNDQKVRISFFIVSSNFHLIRLSKELEKCLEENNYNNIERIVLLGSEDVYEPSVVSSKNVYIKGMIFEIYRHLFELPEFIKLISGGKVL